MQLHEAGHAGAEPGHTSSMQFEQKVLSLEKQVDQILETQVQLTQRQRGVDDMRR